MESLSEGGGNVDLDLIVRILTIFMVVGAAMTALVVVALLVTGSWWLIGLLF